MNLRHRKADERLSVRKGWVDSKWHFPPDERGEPEGFGVLRVFNEHLLAAQAGFRPHAHEELEIVTLLLAGQLEHRDSTGAHQLLTAGDVQRLSAGTGITHSEQNTRTREAAHLLQLWFLPAERGLPPSYAHKRFHAAARKGKLQRILTRYPTQGELPIHQDVDLYLATVGMDDRIEFVPTPGRRQYIHVLRGALEVGDAVLERGDQARITDASHLTIAAAHGTTSNLLLIDLV